MSVARRVFNMWKRTKGNDTANAREPEESPALKPTADYGLIWNGYEIAASVLSDVGCQREINEDCGRYISPDDSKLAANKGVLLLVADGVGGSSAGEVASRTAADIISRVYYEHEGDMQSSLVEAFREANREIQRAATANITLRGMGTTCSAVALNSGRAVSANVGDSRLYLIRDQEIYLMTEDHSVVRELVKHGVISREEARRHPDKNVIVSALGGAEEVSVSTWDVPLPIRIGDDFVVCSDGLSDLVEDREIKETVLAAQPVEACQQLVALAKERGGHDNITVGILAVVSAEIADNKKELRVTRELELAQ